MLILTGSRDHARESGAPIVDVNQMGLSEAATPAEVVQACPVTVAAIA